MKKILNYLKKFFAKKYRYVYTVNCTAGTDTGKTYYANNDVIEYSSIAQIRKINFDPEQDIFLVNVKAYDFVVGRK